MDGHHEITENLTTCLRRAAAIDRPPTLTPPTTDAINMTNISYHLALLWTFCEVHRHAYAIATTKQEQEAVQRCVVQAIKKAGYSPLDDNRVVTKTKSYFDAPEALKDALKQLFQKLGASKGCKVFDFLCNNKSGDMCVFVIFCSMNRKEYLCATNPKDKEWVQRRILSVTKDADLRLSNEEEDCTNTVMYNRTVVEKIPEFIFALEDDEIEACFPFLGQKRIVQLGMLIRGKTVPRPLDQQHFWTQNGIPNHGRTKIVP